MLRHLTRSALVFIMTTCFCASAFADWHCVSRNAKNQRWVANAAHIDRAQNNAVGMCQRSSNIPSNCTLLWCRPY
jgi:hypothetical protein